MRLGVKPTNTRERNLEIILERYKKNPERTIQQVNALSRFTAYNHVKGLLYPLCTCLRCHALNILVNSRNIFPILNIRDVKDIHSENEKRLFKLKP